MSEHDPLIREFEHEKFRPREAEALHTLRKVASLVKPIMRQRGWKVGILTEFWPPEKNLLGLNWNHGQKICLRLRYPYDERQFLPLEEVVDTMLHELSHIVHGPHNEAFHTLWNQLRSENEQLSRKGYTGEGFLSKGHKLGGSSRRIPRHEAQRLARAAAEKRRTLTAGSGQKLGGTPLARGQDMRRVIADAASRRATVTQGCASGTERSRGIVEETSKNGFRTQADEEDANEEAIMLAYIDLIQEEEREKYGESYIPPSKDNPAGSQGVTTPNPFSSPTSPPQQKKPQRPPTSSISPSTQPPLIDLTTPSFSAWTQPWPCEICTLINEPNDLFCDACGTDRPDPPLKPPPPPQPQPQPPSKFNPPSKPKPKSQSSIALDRQTSTATTSSNTPKPKPLGWLCHNCGTWMESEWWTCARCSVMKRSS